MKYLVVLLVVGIGLWMVVARLRGGSGKPSDKAAPGPSAGGPVEMVRCAHCGVHLAATDALTDASRPYCSDAHRRLGPGPAP